MGIFLCLDVRPPVLETCTCMGIIRHRGRESLNTLPEWVVSCFRTEVFSISNSKYSSLLEPNSNSCQKQMCMHLSAMSDFPQKLGCSFPYYVKSSYFPSYSSFLFCSFCCAPPPFHFDAALFHIAVYLTPVGVPASWFFGMLSQACQV